MNNTLQSKVALITGGSRGIGRAIVLELARRGADIAFTGRSLNENTTSLEKEVSALGRKAKAYATDGGKYADTKELVKEVLADFGQIDILVNNAGITRDKLLMRMTEEDWDAVLESNLKSVFNLSQAVITPMMKAKSGVIVNVSSVVGITGNPGQSNYAASKAGAIAFTKSLAKEVGSRGIRVNAVAPGFIQTDMTAALDEKVVKEWTENIPLRRAGEPEEIARAVAFLVSDDASYITGQVLTICGGMCM